ncbi:unnamed protein product [Bursaphelenchus xylophilus]|uniref:(pine wood nematode) hypothetical protein n=1 Tax=Bursaphelenchus xylophilus TaxID=6326 RepID=A0A1I7RLV8_BURXY|nr:unnamed protein product [Bursaphelenchus xylophilus]CAG9106183.1 unnamed protein product [Bursaphelenchus xylophilus]
MSVCSSASTSSLSSILVSDGAPATHSNNHVRFTIPKFSEHVSFKRDFFREPSTSNSQPIKAKKNPKAPMDELEMLRNGYKNQHGHLVHSDSDDDFVETYRRILV